MHNSVYISSKISFCILFTNYKICSIECDEAQEEESDTNMEDLPVQGPLPQDPDDAPFRKAESGGIRKLYVVRFGTGNINYM